MDSPVEPESDAMTMQVLMVTPSYYPIKGGEETVVRNLSSGLNEIGVHTDIMTFNMDRKWNPIWRYKTEKIGGITVYRIPAFNWFPLKHTDRFTLGVNLIPGSFRRYLKYYDIIHFHSADYTFPFFSRAIKKPKILHFHSFYPDLYRRYFLNKFLLRNIASTYISITRKIRRELIEMGISPVNIKLLSNCVDTELFTYSESRVDDTLLFVGRITFNKGLHVLLESLHYLKRKVHLLIIGSKWDPAYFREIEERIRYENRTHNHKITILGEKEPNDMVKWYQRASILVSPSFEEALSMSNLEAMSCGTPVISTSVGGIPEIIQHGKNGLLVPPNRPVELAYAIDSMLSNGELRKMISREAREIVEADYSKKMIIRKLRRIYEEMAS